MDSNYKHIKPVQEANITFVKVITDDHIIDMKALANATEAATQSAKGFSDAFSKLEIQKSAINGLSKNFR